MTTAHIAPSAAVQNPAEALEAAHHTVPAEMTAAAQSPAEEAARHTVPVGEDTASLQNPDSAVQTRHSQAAGRSPVAAVGTDCSLAAVEGSPAAGSAAVEEDNCLAVEGMGCLVQRQQVSAAAHACQAIANPMYSRV